MSEVAKLLKTFEDIATNPGRQLGKMVAMERKVVGCLPPFTPEELVVAAGMIPFGIWGAEREIAEAKKYFPSFYCSLAQTSLEMGLRGELDQLSAVLIPIACDTLKCLGQNWKVGVPQVPFIQVSHPQNVMTSAGTLYLKKIYGRIAERLGEISGQCVSEATLRSAITIYNEHRDAMRTFSKVAAAHPELVSPYQRSCVFKSAFFSEKSVHCEMVQVLIAELEKQPPASWPGKKIVLTGVIADSPELLKIVASNGLAVVADELLHESRQYMHDAPMGGDPFDALARQYTSMKGCSLLADPHKTRGPLLVEMARQANAGGVLHVSTKFCDPYEFDYPLIKRDLEQAGIPVLNIEFDQQMQSFEQVRTAVQTFSSMLA